MPLPYWVARLNKRVTNRLIEPLVRHSRHYAVVHHTGRSTGRACITPVFVFFGRGHGYISLTYGPRTDWVQNVRASGGRCEHDGAVIDLSVVEVVTRAEARHALPRWVRLFLTVLRVDDFLVIDER